MRRPWLPDVSANLNAGRFVEYDRDSPWHPAFANPHSCKMSAGRADSVPLDGAGSRVDQHNKTFGAPSLRG
jgi:hypothetical protein